MWTTLPRFHKTKNLTNFILNSGTGRHKEKEGNYSVQNRTLFHTMQ